ncbi:Serine/threonine-protein phosphatase 4 regulatory subunit 4 [Porphyridium purpureum]|uniref:Serine/threonine-protein phosphatase 4 regulatory subunit 4 n=1 Tax=Porphyridium purpureum TaxID=35688 RepID=A0A5J4Z880_PORPP|nr:Serine/threonine-protein phosphatase 4 regulatory subunit 4 [Porphyridium purpureum]|eukprot:POR1916..scf295_1
MAEDGGRTPPEPSEALRGMQRNGTRAASAESAVPVSTSTTEIKHGGEAGGSPNGKQNSASANGTGGVALSIDMESVAAVPGSNYGGKGMLVRDEEPLLFLNHSQQASLFSITKMAELLRDGTEQQRSFVLVELQQLFDHCLMDTLNVLLPALCAHVHEWAPELQVAAAEALLDITHLALPPLVAKMITAAAFRVVQTSTRLAIFEAWGEILVATLPLAVWNKEELLHIVALIDSHAARSSLASRKLAARVLGALSLVGASRKASDSDVDHSGLVVVGHAKSESDLRCVSDASVLQPEPVRVESYALIETSVVPRVLKLAFDSDIEVQGMSTESLAFVGSALPLPRVYSLLWSTICALLDSCEARIRAATLRSVAHIVQAHKAQLSVPRQTASGSSNVSAPSGCASPEFAAVLTSLFLKHCNLAALAAAADQRIVSDEKYLLLEIFSEVFGALFEGAAACAHAQSQQQAGVDSTLAVKLDALKCFIGMSTCNGPIIRRHCAYNLPGVALILGSKYARDLSQVFEYLSNDPDTETRWILAAGLSALASTFAPCAVQSCESSSHTRICMNLCAGFMALIHDENTLVRIRALEHLAVWIRLLCADVHGSGSAVAVTSASALGPAAAVVTAVTGSAASSASALKPAIPSAATTSDFTKRLSPIFLSLEVISEGNWRTQQLLADQLLECVELIPGPILLEHVLPFLFRLAEESVCAVRTTAMQVVAACIRCIGLPQLQAELLEHFRMEWSQCGVFWMRMAFLDCGVAAAHSYSARLFRTLFATPVLRLAADPVPNVRIKLARHLDRLFERCHNMTEFMTAAELLLDDDDADVRAAAQTAYPANLDVDERLDDRWMSTEDERLEQEALYLCKAQQDQRWLDVLPQPKRHLRAAPKEPSKSDIEAMWSHSTSDSTSSNKAVSGSTEGESRSGVKTASSKKASRTSRSVSALFANLKLRRSLKAKHASSATTPAATPAMATEAAPDNSLAPSKGASSEKSATRSSVKTTNSAASSAGTSASMSESGLRPSRSTGRSASNSSGDRQASASPAKFLPRSLFRGSW